MEQELYKIRSASACIKSAYNLFGANLKTIFRRMWLPALSFAFIMAAVLLTSTLSAQAIIKHPQMVLVYKLFQSSLSLLVIVTLIWVVASLFTMLNQRGLWRNILQTTKLFFLQMAIGIVLSAIVAIPVVASIFHQLKTMQTTQEGNAVHAAAQIQPLVVQTLLSPTVLITIAITILIVIFIELLLLPIYYFYVKYMMEPIHMRTNLWKSFKTGLRRWGFIFLTFFMTTLILMCFFLILFMPLGILNIAQSQSLAGVVMGDPAALPNYFLFLQFITALFTFFILTFFIAWTILVAYYAYGSIEQKEIERKSIIPHTIATTTTSSSDITL